MFIVGTLLTGVGMYHYMTAKPQPKKKSSGFLASTQPKANKEDTLNLYPKKNKTFSEQLSDTVNSLFK